MAESGTGHNGHDVTLPPDADPASAGGGATLATHESGPGDGGSPDADGEVLATGAKVGRYIVVDRLGAGAMGVVYAAYDPKLDRKIALKLLLPQKGGGDHARRTARLEREAQAIAKLSHPNVVGIFDVVVHEDRVVLAMEYLGGGTLRDWIAAKKRPWREILKMFIEVGKGLAAAHAEGQIHRDFKPDNVLLDKNGVPKVVDFGLVRLTSLSGSTTDSADGDDAEGAELAALLPAVAGPAGLTRTGALAGTPAYMAPEQFLGTPIDARTDQFAFCVALYEALHGERPFAGQTMIALAESVTVGRTREVSKESDVPGWVRRITLRGLQPDPAARFGSIDDLLRALLDDPAVRRRKRALVGASVVALVVIASFGRYITNRRNREVDERISKSIRDGETLLTRARFAASRFSDKRQQAMQLFSKGQRPAGEKLWREALSDSLQMDNLFSSAASSLEAARVLRPMPELTRRLTETLLEAGKTNEYQDRPQQASTFFTRLQADVGDSVLPSAVLSISVDVHPASLSIQHYGKSSDGSLALTGITEAAIVKSFEQQFQRGSYLLRVSSPSRVTVSYPITLRAGEHVALSIAVPLLADVPAGFSYVPAGRFYFGEGDESLRTGFTNSPPLHEGYTEGFLIAKREISYADWLRFLSALPPEQVSSYLPRSNESVIQALIGSVKLTKGRNGHWHVRFVPVSRAYEADEGEDIVYADRETHRRNNWLAMPVTGVSGQEIASYASWLDTTGQLRGARLCREKEWERAARGSDDRRFPHGDKLNPDDANFDATYGRIGTAYGLDEGGSHPQSRSPFGVDDLSGNAWEITTSDLFSGELILRGGGYYHNDTSALVTNREEFPNSARSAHIGSRICSDLPRTFRKTTIRVGDAVDLGGRFAGHNQ